MQVTIPTLKTEAPTIKAYNFRALQKKFENGDFAIPEIQRQYVWNKNRVANLMDSIFKNYPIGICLIWNASFSDAIHIRHNHKTILPPYNTRANYVNMVIDGQQRLSTLYGILKGLEKNIKNNSMIDFKELFFNCDKTAPKRFIFSKRIDPFTKGYIRVYDLINTTPSGLKRRLKLNQLQTQEIIKCYNAIHKYKFYMLEFKMNDIDDIKEIFIRINSAGMSVNRADTIFAKASNVELRSHMIDAKRRLKNGYDNVSDDTLQSVLALAYGAKHVTGRGKEVLLAKIQKNKKNDNEFSRIWKRLQYGYEVAVDFLVNQLKIKHPSLLPYQNIYTLLSYFFFLNRSRVKPAQFKEIKKWFWHTSCGERYSGAAFNRNIPEDINFFERLARNPNTKYSVTERVTPLDFLKTNYRKSSTISNAYFILLRNKKPLYLSNGHEMMLDENSSISNRKDRHHIYPSALLRRNNINPKWINSICNICYIESNENQSISDAHPKNYLQSYKRSRHFGRVMQSHIIPVKPSSPVWEIGTKKSFLNFLNMRGKLIISEIEKQAGAKIFEKFDSIKRI